MISIKVELWPRGFGIKVLTHDRTSATLHHLCCVVTQFEVFATDKVQRTGRAEDHPRQSYSVWELVRRALTTAYGKT